MAGAGASLPPPLLPCTIRESGPVKRSTVEQRRKTARKPEESYPAHPDRAERGSREVVPPTRVYWCHRHPELTAVAQCLAVYVHLTTGCEHEALAHCPTCAEPHIRDLALTLAGKAYPRAR